MQQHSISPDDEQAGEGVDPQAGALDAEELGEAAGGGLIEWVRDLFTDEKEDGGCFGGGGGFGGGGASGSW